MTSSSTWYASPLVQEIIALQRQLVDQELCRPDPGEIHRCSDAFPCILQTGTDYGPYLANEPSPLHTTTIVDRCTEKLVDDWNKMRTNVSFLPGPHHCLDVSLLSTLTWNEQQHVVNHNQCILIRPCHMGTAGCR